MSGILLPSMAGGIHTTGDEYARRVRAAVAYTDKRPPELAEPGLSERTIFRYMEDGGPLTPNGDRRTRARIAQVCGVPDWFMERGFETPAEGDRALRLARMAGELAALQRRVEELTAGEEAP